MLMEPVRTDDFGACATAAAAAVTVWSAIIGLDFGRDDDVCLSLDFPSDFFFFVK